MKLLIPKYTIATFAILYYFMTQNVKAQVNTQDSLALVDLYDSTVGANWSNNSNWLTKAPVSSWYGITVIGKRVTGIDFGNGNKGNNLNGNMPSSLEKLTNLTSLLLNYNKLKGPIPTSLGNLSKLTTLYLYHNQLTGFIPSSLGNLIKLTQLNLDRNQLTGSIPTSLGNLTSLTNLLLSNNQLTGSIPASLGNLGNLTLLALNKYQLSGSIFHNFCCMIIS